MREIDKTGEPASSIFLPMAVGLLFLAVLVTGALLG